MLIGLDLVAWTQRLCLTGELRAAEPKRLRYALWRCAARIIRHSRRVRVRLDAAWPWTAQLTDGFAKLRALPALR